MKVRVRLVCLGLVGAVAALSGCGLLPKPRVAVPITPAPLVFESDEFVVTFAREGDSTEDLAARFLGDAGKAWMIEDYNRSKRFTAGQEVVIPKQAWNPVGVDPQGYQVVPVLVYHNIGPETKGRLVIAARTFEEQMRYIKARGYRVVSLSELHEFFAGRRQLPRNAVALSFDDGYRSFLQYAYPVLKELDFRATLFVYTDYVGVGRNALGWPELAQLAHEGFDIQGHSKTHGDLRRRRDESAADYGRRMQAELGEPLTLFERHLGQRPDLFAYPYGYYDEDLVQKLHEFGYVGAFTVRRDANPSFVGLYRARRAQIYGDMTLDEFGRILGVFSAEAIR
jgi:peptidoglycan/xylan/chitin deacetylase (PgdA/CDA1 family)